LHIHFYLGTGCVDTLCSTNPHPWRPPRPRNNNIRKRPRLALPKQLLRACRARLRPSKSLNSRRRAAASAMAHQHARNDDKRASHNCSSIHDTRAAARACYSSYLAFFLRLTATPQVRCGMPHRPAGSRRVCAAQSHQRRSLASQLSRASSTTHLAGAESTHHCTARVHAT
jgi:hypothetical protein